MMDSLVDVSRYSWTAVTAAPSSVPKLMALYGFRKLVCLLDDPWRDDLP